MQNPQSQTVSEPKRLDWTTMVVPFLLIIILCLCFLAAPDASKAAPTLRFISLPCTSAAWA